MVISTGSELAKAARRLRAALLPLEGGMRWSQGHSDTAPEADGNRERPAVTGPRQTDPGHPDTLGGNWGKLLSPARCRLCVGHVGQFWECRSSGPAGCCSIPDLPIAMCMCRWSRTTSRHSPTTSGGWLPGSVGTATADHRDAQTCRLWQNDGSCVRLSVATRGNNVWANYFVQIRV